MFPDLIKLYKLIFNRLLERNYFYFPAINVLLIENISFQWEMYIFSGYFTLKFSTLQTLIKWIPFRHALQAPHNIFMLHQAE